LYRKSDVVFEQDKLRMCGAKAERHVFLFKRALLVAKKRDDVTMSVKAFIEVTLNSASNKLVPV